MPSTSFIDNRQGRSFTRAISLLGPQRPPSGSSVRRETHPSFGTSDSRAMFGLGLWNCARPRREIHGSQFVLGAVYRRDINLAETARSSCIRRPGRGRSRAVCPARTKAPAGEFRVGSGVGYPAQALSRAFRGLLAPLLRWLRRENKSDRLFGHGRVPFFERTAETGYVRNHRRLETLGASAATLFPALGHPIDVPRTCGVVGFLASRRRGSSGNWIRDGRERFFSPKTITSRTGRNPRAVSLSSRPQWPMPFRRRDHQRHGPVMVATGQANPSLAIESQRRYPPGK